ncbi:MAG: PQQ-binding-like beta-propeller repeat protein [Candidatus Aenigmarchaeota archaeon]|nr:PQQ-binding-like beta-propeller repeat protein [Candidatus Aenigmarchaeota archaeon]
MTYEKKEDLEYRGERPKDYYIAPSKEEEKEDQKLPSFKEVFNDLPKSGAIAMFPEYYAGVLYFSSLDSFVYAVDAKSGIMIWKFQTAGPSMSVPLVHKGKIYFGSTDEYFYCLDLTGKLLWKKHTGDMIVSSPIGIGDKIFILNGSGYFFCFSEDGKELWKFKCGDGSPGIPSTINSLIFLGSYDSHLYALNLDGELKWKFRAGERIGSPVIMENGKTIISNLKRSFEKPPQANSPKLYSPSYDNNIYSFDEHGKILWKFNCGSSITGGIGAANGSIYAGGVNGFLHSVDAFTGKEKWIYRTGGIITSGAEIKDGYVYVTSFDQKLHCIKEDDGSRIWDFLTGGPIVARPVIIENKIYFGSADSFLYCIDLENRSVQWAFRTSLVTSGLEEKIKSFVNAIAEYDKKIFKVWRPETSTGKAAASAVPEGFSFGGEEVYKSSTGGYKSGDLSYFGKKKPYKH